MARLGHFLAAVFDLSDEAQAPLDLVERWFSGQRIGQEPGQRFDDVLRVQLPFGVEQGRSVSILLADYEWTAREVVEHVTKLQLEEAALFFHNEEGLQAVGEFGAELRLEREGHPELRDADSQRLQIFRANPEDRKSVV